MWVDFAEVVPGPDERRKTPDVSLEDALVNGVLLLVRVARVAARGIFVADTSGCCGCTLCLPTLIVVMA